MLARGRDLVVHKGSSRFGRTQGGGNAITLGLGFYGLLERRGVFDIGLNMAPFACATLLARTATNVEDTAETAIAQFLRDELA